MKVTNYSRSLLKLCRRMKTYQWKLVGRTIRSVHGDGCPLSVCGAASAMQYYREGGANLGFTPGETESVVLYADDPIGAGIVASSQERKILLKAARL